MMASTTSRTITIDPITRLEGHGKISIFLDTNGEVERAYFQVPELRGFEKFVQGRPVEDMPQITSRICGVCPMAHHLAATKALDAIYRVTPPAAARKIRELAYSIFFVEDHLLHFFFLGGPDFVVGPEAPASDRNILGVVNALGRDAGLELIGLRKRLRELLVEIAGKAIHPVFGLPGGVSKPLASETKAKASEVSAEAIDFAVSVLEKFEHEIAPRYMDAIVSDDFTHKTYYMGLVDERNLLNFYDGTVRMITPLGSECGRFPGVQYLDFIAEHVEPWSYVKFCYLKSPGWQGFKDGTDSGVYSVGPLARINVADGIATPRAQEARARLFSALGDRPVHHTLAIHWARLIEVLYAAERMKELADDPEICEPHVRTIPSSIAPEGVGIVEAPRGTLIHHYKVDANGIVVSANLIVATQNNAARIALSVDKAAKALIHGGIVSEGILNRIEMSFRAYDPCNGCATHSLPGNMPLEVEVRDCRGALLQVIRRAFTAQAK
jgi:F420-non-reducing hydrogenase large subunit